MRMNRFSADSASNWPRRSKMVKRCQTLPTVDPILKNSAFDLMTDLSFWLPRHQFEASFFNDSNELQDSTTTHPGFVPGIHVGPPPRSLPARTAMR